MLADIDTARKKKSTFIFNTKGCFIVAPVWIPNINVNPKWSQNGVTVAGGNGKGNGLNQLSNSWSVYVDDNETVFVGDYDNHRIVEWKKGATSGQVVAGGNGVGNRIDQLNGPVHVIVDKETDSLIITDFHNKRVVRWPRQNGTSGEIIISNVGCWGAAMDNDGYLYVSDYDTHEVKRWKLGDTTGTVVAGGNGQGNRLDQLSRPRYTFVDQDHSVYVTDANNHRVMKWIKGAKEGVIVAGGQGAGNGLTQLSSPFGISVDELGTVYVADYDNHRVMRWWKGATQGSVVVGGNASGGQANQLNGLCGLAFDQQNNLYVVDYNNHRVQKFNVDRS